MCSWESLIFSLQRMWVITLSFPHLTLSPMPRSHWAISGRGKHSGCNNSKYFMVWWWLRSLGLAAWPIKEFQKPFPFEFGLLRDTWTGGASVICLVSSPGPSAGACLPRPGEPLKRRGLACHSGTLTWSPESKTSCSKAQPALNKHRRAGLPSEGCHPGHPSPLFRPFPTETQQVSISSGCHNKIPSTGWLDRNLFLRVLEARKPRSRCQEGQCLVRAVVLWVADSCLLWHPHTAFPLCSHGEKERNHSLSFL